MTNKEYVEGVLRTEAPVTPEMLERFKNTTYMGILMTFMQEARVAGEGLDIVKKYLYYGKGAAGAKNAELLDRWQKECAEDENVARAIAVMQDPKLVRLLHSILGMATEVGELIEAFGNHMFPAKQKPLDEVNLKEEVGDLMWYQGIFADVMDTTFEEMQETNNRKLRARYPEKFTEKHAIERDLVSERQVLELDEVERGAVDSHD